MIAQVIFLLERRHTQTQNVTDATDQCSAIAGLSDEVRLDEMDWDESIERYEQW